MKDVEKFEQLLNKIGTSYINAVACSSKGNISKSAEIILEISELEEELIKMYEEAINSKEFYEKQYNDLYDRS